MTEDDAIINVGVSGPGVVKYALESVRGKSFEVLAKLSRRRHLRLQELDSLLHRRLLRDSVYLLALLTFHLHQLLLLEIQ